MSFRRALHRSTPGWVILTEPGEFHDGHAPDEAGFTYLLLDPGNDRDARAYFQSVSFPSRCSGAGAPGDV
ncbi:hypothetical protein F0U62_03870 [Cystobacter fuscus]|uniref:AraC family ligand binding domain-containing protein n=1 Tax=Cystobacter fuscus TaxID=43 RepID=UPI002B311A4A|nr:hypothetical protein F0U62_03870 [Cystobacter fuscus]